MKPVHDFKKQLDNFDLEATVIASYVYAEMAILHAASKSKKLLAQLNVTSTFWKTCFAAFQTGAYIALGRVFDKGSPYNLEAILTSMEVDIQTFSRESLAQRKSENGFNDPARLKDYVSKAHVLTVEDIRRIRRSVARRRAIYDRAIMHVRHRYLAHRQTHDHVAVDSLYARGKVKEMWQLSIFLVRLHQELSSLYVNGKKPNLRLRFRYSPKVMYDKKANIVGPHERMVNDVRKLMELIESTARDRSN